MKIQFIPTKNIFDLPDSICDELMANDRSNYRIIKDNAQAPKAKKPAAKEKVINVKGKKTQEPEKEDKKEDKKEE